MYNMLVYIFHIWIVLSYLGLGMLPSIDKFSSLPVDEKSASLGLLFEPCPTLVDLALPLTNELAKSWPELVERIRAALLQLPTTDPRVVQIIAAHPRLGARKINSAQSQAEQANLGGSQQEAELLSQANSLYEQTFPGLRYVVFVAGRSRPEILKDMHARIAENNYDAEVGRAFNAMCDIALDRQSKLISHI